MRGHRRRRTTKEIVRQTLSPEGGGGTASIFLSLRLDDAQWHRLRGRFAISRPSRSPQTLPYL
ncbi:hypothetical protein MYX65_02800 [Acidobacteria bacterium AH-259-L09]|nr:hypothetical protein [Acidobacteria bacterium AH-259-L09]